MGRNICTTVAAAAVMLAFAADTYAQRGGGGGAQRPAAPATRSIERPVFQRDWRPAPDRVDPLQARVRAACAADTSADFCAGRQDRSHLRRRLWNACHGDHPPPACRRVFGADDDNAHLRRRVWNACHAADAPPSFCRRIFGRDPGDPHLRRRIWNACDDGDLSPAFCRRIFGGA